MTPNKSSWLAIRKSVYFAFFYLAIVLGAIAFINEISKIQLNPTRQSWTPIVWRNETKIIIKSGINYSGCLNFKYRYDLPYRDKGTGLPEIEIQFINETACSQFLEIKQNPTIEGKDCKIIEQENIYYEQGKGWQCYVGQLKEKCSESCNPHGSCFGGCSVWCEPTFINKTICSQCRDAQTKEIIECPN